MGPSNPGGFSAPGQKSRSAQGAFPCKLGPEASTSPHDFAVIASCIAAAWVEIAGRNDPDLGISVTLPPRGAKVFPAGCGLDRVDLDDDFLQHGMFDMLAAKGRR
ncbi:hypothetical protein HG15A2_09990 [Adhaeretor mobilis]|uniref:Uncharacterized protein n=1 Tax=Adhaeretor mobilis TaxID=1930276 RepID=A0A517MS74_9BACT|nr:hypothetical protein HG15A2_09990 [Adhaeretor mobilis]